jgi:hypothetical protein
MNYFPHGYFQMNTEFLVHQFREKSSQVDAANEPAFDFALGFLFLTFCLSHADLATFQPFLQANPE